MDVLRQDLRFALRLLSKDRAFAVTTILTLALCIGATTAIFTVVRSVLLRPLPYPESDRLVFMFDGSRAPASSVRAPLFRTTWTGWRSPMFSTLRPCISSAGFG